jgi:histidyl-tRNA synthetase
MIPREMLLEKARVVYRSYGFAPIDTPALEHAKILLGKGGGETDRQLYRFTHRDHDVALRFDLTVPFARFAAQHVSQLGIPFKRYHMGPVWRGEKPQKGRYREFWQCDFDTIGTTSTASDAEVVLVIHDLMRAIGFERFEVRVNHRLILNGLLEGMGLSAKAGTLLTALDKLPKAGAAAVSAEMIENGGADAGQAERILSLAKIEGDSAAVLERLRSECGDNPKIVAGVAQLRQLVVICKTAGISDERLRIDLSIARGLEYYTGTVYETFLTDRPEFGSVCSGGRYDNLASLYTKQALPGVGASLGLDRLLAAMEELDLLPKASTPAPVLIVQFDSDRVGDYQRMGRSLRAAGIGVELYPDAKKVGQQLRYAEARGFRFALLAGSDEFAMGVWKVKDLAAREESQVSEPFVLETIQKLLAKK